MRISRAIAALVGTMMLLIGATSVVCAGEAPEQLGMRGTIGSHPIAMIASFDDDGSLSAIHYSYASQKKRIPLTGNVDGDHVMLREPSGGVFDLHFTAQRPGEQNPTSFRTATGLAGSWHLGERTLPVSLSIVLSRDHLEDCIFYPPPNAGPGPHFPERGCEHVPDKAQLDACSSASFVSDTAVMDCIDRSMHSCREDQFNTNLCTMNVASFLDQRIGQRVSAKSASIFTPADHARWKNRREASCKATSQFGREGSGYGADISRCMAAEELRLLQKDLHPSDHPIRKRRDPD